MSSDYVSKKLVKAEYAVRGLIASRADEIRAEMAAGKKFPFDSILACNIGNPQAIGQKPFTFNRQVMALVDAPMLLDNPKIVNELPADVVARAREALAEIGPATGAYTTSRGYLFVRRDAAKYITERDRKNSGNADLPAADPNKLVITDGSSNGVRMILQMLLDGPTDACMIPIPQYPLYSALLTMLDATAAPYHLREESGWGLTIQDLEKSYSEAQAKGATPRCIVIINPGNPTGQVLSKEVMQDIIKFTHSKKMVLMADEVYMENVYAKNKQFHSFREVMLTMGAPYSNELMLVSLHTVSKGLIGECGRRGGYFEHLNFPKILEEQIVKMISINLCSNVNGQLMVSLMCRGPAPGDASYESHKAEYDGIYNELCRKAEHLATELNKITGFSCNPVEGAMYAFPRITLPKGFIAYNEEKNKQNNQKLAPDTRYCLDLLEETGIVLVAGSGFGQEEGTLHFRTTILPPEAGMKRFTESIRAFHTKIMEKYA